MSTVGPIDNTILLAQTMVPKKQRMCSAHALGSTAGLRPIPDMTARPISSMATV